MDTPLPRWRLYYTVIVPFVDPPNASQWHPTQRSFAPLTRGSFATEGDAIAWARENLGGAPYTVKRIENPADE